MDIDREWIAIACLTRVRGNKGELEAIPFSEAIDRHQSLGEVFLYGPDPRAEARLMRIETIWVHGDRWIFKFCGIDSIDAARLLAGAEVRIPASERPPAPSGEYYQTDLVGCEVVDRASAARLGVVVGWQEFGSAPLLEVEAAADHRWWLPFARSICVEIDLEKRRIAVDLPAGLAELNQI